MAGLFTTIGVMTIPLVLVLKIEAPETSHWIFYGLLILGFISLGMGIISTLYDEKKQRKQIAFFAFTLAAIAEKFGVDMDKVTRDMEDDNGNKRK